MEYRFSMVAKHVNKVFAEDRIFAANGLAVQAAAKFGKDKVVNATVGSILNDREELAVMSSVMDVFRSIPDDEVAAYAPIAGTGEFINASIEAAFGNRRPDAYIKGVATPGGSGAIRHAIWNYSEIGDTVLTADWYWGPYKTMATENMRKLETFQLFDDNRGFNLTSFSRKVKELLDRQGRLVILMNSPANNPTGFALSDDEWEQVLEVLKVEAKDTEKRIVLVADIAYIDYAGDPDGSRSFMKKFSGLPENIFIIVAFSVSKSLTMYGLRTGAALGVSSSKEIAEEFSNVCQSSNRGTWSNGTRCGMKLLSVIMNDKAVLGKVSAERQQLKQLLEDRAAIFVREAAAAGLEMHPYKAGFFVTIPAKDSEAICKRLEQDNIFPVPISGGIRFAVCSVPAEKLKGVAVKIKNAI